MSAVERAAEVIRAHSGKRDGGAVGLARTLADAGLLLTDADRAVLDAAKDVADACDETKTHEDYYHLHPCCNGADSENEFFQSVLDNLCAAVRARRSARLVGSAVNLAAPAPGTGGEHDTAETFPRVSAADLRESHVIEGVI